MSDLFQNLIYSKEDIIHFPEGIPGFDNMVDFVVVQVPDHAPFEWLVSVQNPHLRFVILNPLLFIEDYDPKISKEQLSILEVTKPGDLLVYVIVTLKEHLSDSTANCIGPVFINRQKKVGKQIVIDSDKYSVQEPIVREKSMQGKTL